MKNLEINLNLTNSSNSENIDEVNQESDQSTTKDTTPGNSSTQSITLQLSSDKKNSSHEKSSTENDEVERNKSSNKLKTPVKRRLFVKNHKNASFIRFSNDENISTQEEQIVLPNPYNPTKPNENCTKSKSTNLSIKPIQTYVHIKQFPKSGFKNIQYRNKLPTLVISDTLSNDYYFVK